MLVNYFDQISQDTGQYCFGTKDTMSALDLGAVDKLLIWEDLPINRYEVINGSTGEKKVLFLTPAQEADKSNFQDGATGVDLEVQDKQSLVEWFATHYKDFGTK